MDSENNVVISSTTNNEVIDSSPNRSKYQQRYHSSSKSLLQSSTSSSSLPRRPLHPKALPNHQQRTSVISSVTSASNSSSSAEVQELKTALAEALKENEALSETVKLLKVEIERLAGEVDEQQEYAELYLLSRELIEQQSEEIADLKRRLSEYETGADGSKDKEQQEQEQEQEQE